MSKSAQIVSASIGSAYAGLWYGELQVYVHQITPNTERDIAELVVQLAKMGIDLRKDAELVVAAVQAIRQADQALAALSEYEEAQSLLPWEERRLFPGAYGALMAWRGRQEWIFVDQSFMNSSTYVLVHGLAAVESAMAAWLDYLDR